MTLEAKIEIIGGPSREDLRDALGSRKDHRFQVTFVLNGHARDVAMVNPFPLDQDKIELVANVNGMEWEDGSGESWNLRCYAVRINGQDELISRPFMAYYRTDKRKGQVTFTIN